MNLIYHGCGLKFLGSTNVIIGPQKCITPKNQCFWKHRDDIKNKVSTRLQEK